MDLTHEALPEAVRRGLQRMQMDGVHFAPVRHHSPACALALQAMVRELRPEAILIEGPDSFDALLPLLHDARTRPPVAILSQAAGDGDGATRSAFFPFCDYSPEWVALQLARETGADAAFIDLPWQVSARTGHAASHEQADTARAHSLMAERYLAHSAWVAALARACGCRDQDELWDHLFELRTPAALRDWRRLFGDVFAYCAMARAGYEPEVLEAEGSLARERHMAAHIRRHQAALTGAGRAGTVVVVCGGFHAIALQQLLAGDDCTAAHQAAPQPAAGLPARDWLVRYGFERLDALNGYEAGMPSPAWHQWVWDSAQADPDGPHLDQVAAHAIARLARHGRARDLADQASTADVQQALSQALRLAALRGHAGPGRADLLDALRSCFVKDALDEGNAGFALELERFLGGSALGDIPPSSASPPLLEDARRRARDSGIRLDDGTPRAVRLELYRKERHRMRSRFLHLMDYLGAGLGSWRGGPDFAAGSGLELLVEEWQVAWSPLVEARLIELAGDGATLAEVALARLRREEAALDAAGQARSAGAAAGLLTRACLIGLHARLPALFALVERRLAHDPDLDSTAACARALLNLWRGHAPLGVQDHDGVHALLAQAWSASLQLLPDLAGAGADQERGALRTLVELRAIRNALGTATMRDAPQAGQAQARSEAWRSTLGRLAGTSAPGLALAAGALLFLDGAWSGEHLGALLAARFGPGAMPQDAVRALSGLMTAAPELVLTWPQLQTDLDRILGGWDEATFIAHLPDLRLAFAALKPRETAQLARSLAHTHADLEAAVAPVHYDLRESDLTAAVALQDQLAQCLRRDGLQAWIADERP